MGQFDSFKSIAMLFTGAFLVSFGVIYFLNIEIQSRQNHGVKIRNENLFEVLGRKISQMLSTLRERNSYRRTLLYHLFVAENTTRTSLRKLQHFTEDTANNDNMTEQYFLRIPRRLRHEKKIKRLTELLKEKNNSVSRETIFNIFNLEKEYKAIGNSSTATHNGPTNNRTATDNPINSTKKDRLEGMEVHQRCYTTNDVLEIIAITCLVNFIFWFMIIFCVNVFTRNPKMWKFNSFESLTSVGTGSECELTPSNPKKDGHFHALNQQNFLKDYVNSLATETERMSSESELQEPFLREYSNSKETSNSPEGEKWIHQSFLHFSNIFFDTVSLDNLKPVKKKNFVSRNKNNTIVNSFSMEDLIF